MAAGRRRSGTSGRPAANDDFVAVKDGVLCGVAYYAADRDVRSREERECSESAVEYRLPIVRHLSIFILRGFDSAQHRSIFILRGFDSAQHLSIFILRDFDFAQHGGHTVESRMPSLRGAYQLLLSARDLRQRGANALQRCLPFLGELSLGRLDLRQRCQSGMNRFAEVRCDLT